VSGTQRRAGRTTQLTLTSSVTGALSLRSRELTSEEERVVRARHGAALPRDARLETKAGGEVEDELLLIEMELRRRYRAHLALQARAPAAGRKDKVVRALRRQR
jgi:hypothetical protein